MKRVDPENFAKLLAQVEGAYEEISLLSKKSPNDAVNKFKLAFLNTLIAEANRLLGSARRPFQDFDLFDEDSVPQNSDVVFILSQYLKCLEAMNRELF